MTTIQPLKEDFHSGDAMDGFVRPPREIFLQGFFILLEVEKWQGNLVLANVNFWI